MNNVVAVVGPAGISAELLLGWSEALETERLTLDEYAGRSDGKLANLLTSKVRA